MFENYSDPDPDEPRETITVDAPLTQRLVEPDLGEIPPPVPENGAEAGFLAIEFEHPNGETGIILTYRGPANKLAEAFDLKPIDETETVMPFKHKADGGNNFLLYGTDDDDDTVQITMTEASYHDFRETLINSGAAK